MELRVFDLSDISLPGAVAGAEVGLFVGLGAKGSLACFIFLGGVALVRSTSSGAILAAGGDFDVTDVN